MVINMEIPITQMYLRNRTTYRFLNCAPFTLRMAISLRRCSQLSVMKEKIPKAAMSTQISEAKPSNFNYNVSDFRNLEYSSSILRRE